MPDLNFQVAGVEVERHAAAPLLRFALRVTDAAEASAPVHAVALRCQIRIEPGRRRYRPPEQERLLDLFGTPDRWARTVHPMLWQHATTVVPRFTGATGVDLPVPCSYDFNQAPVKYFDALEDGEIPLCFLFSGTIFYEEGDGALQVAQVPWAKEATYRLPVGVWRGLMDRYYPNGPWLRLRQDVFDRLSRYKSGLGVETWEQALHDLLSAAEERGIAPNGLKIAPTPAEGDG